ncbi:hypothetical protein AB0B68_17645 [Micromonospora sp. NPDC049049]|uniref:hypothetical protein n=1 Tax=Micromonospora sp. NPDC049049 TaxID=3155495 RepID=UPI0034079162
MTSWPGGLPMLQPSLINDWLGQRPDFSLRIVSVCAGQGHDLIGALAPRSDATRVCAELIEYHPRNVAAGRMGITAAGLNGITATQADAGDFAAYRRAPLLIWSLSPE